MSESPRLILFDLDSTLIDHPYAQKSAILAVWQEFAILSPFTVSEISTAYSSVSDITENAVERGDVSIPESETQRVVLFFQFLGLPPPSLQICTRFRDLYRAIYKRSIQATPGAIGTLLSLEARGCKLAALTLGDNKEQLQKMKDLGLHDAVDLVISLADVALAMPDPRIVNMAMDKFGATKQTTCLVGGNEDLHVKCAIQAGVLPIWCRPEILPDGQAAPSAEIERDGKQVLVVHEMSQILNVLRGRL